jgi:hypothetical protein
MEKQQDEVWFQSEHTRKWLYNEDWILQCCRFYWFLGCRQQDTQQLHCVLVLGKILSPQILTTMPWIGTITLSLLLGTSLDWWPCPF